MSAGLPLGSGLFNQDSNTGSCHSDVGVNMVPTIGGVKELDPSPEKPVTSARTPTDRKRKRKTVTSGTNPADPAATAPIGAAVAGDPGGKSVKKINEYFPKHTPSSPVRTVPAGIVTGGTKSPLPFNANPGLYPQSPQAQYVSSPSSSQGPLATGDFTTLMQPPKLPAVTKSVQTDLSGTDIVALESRSAAEMESKENRIDDLQRINDEMQRQLAKSTKDLESQKSTVTKCLNVVKELLIEKSTIERKDARSKVMQNRLRLGQFVTQRVGASFQENWTDGYAFQELAKKQEDIANEREEIDRQKKLLAKRKPVDTNGPTRKRATSAAISTTTGGGSNNVTDSGLEGRTNSGPGNSSTSIMCGLNVDSQGSTGNLVTPAPALHNGNTDETMFTKPPPRDGMTQQEYYEAEEVLRLRYNTLKKEDSEMQLEMEKLERSRNLHIRELKRIHNEDQSRYNRLHTVLAQKVVAEWQIKTRIRNY
jgi:tousled-like kinase